MKRLFVLFSIFCCATALAGPSRPIQSSTFSVQTPCGPDHDPFAQQGQWFLNLGTGATNVNTREYHDEDNSLAISGVVQNIQFSDPGNPYSNIMGFDIRVTVSNTLPADYTYGSASNSHSEVQISAAVTPGGSTMSDVRITAEFAIPNAGTIPSGISPYWPDPFSQGQYYIVALNADEHAWYCWDPNQTDQQYQPTGAYQVPAWNLTPSIIPPGGTATVTMKFQVTGTGIPYGTTDYRHGVLRYSQDTGADVLYNRYPSLKISHWLDTIVVDNGVTLTTPPSPYWEEEPLEYVYASDASVFYNDEEPEYDWGDLPDSYNTLAANNGANHRINMNYILGSLIDAEPDGLPTVTAKGDDMNNLADEDGITFTSAFVPGQSVSFKAAVSAAGQLDIWMDLNQNGAWDLPNEHVFTGGVSAGLNPLSFTVPIGTAPGQNDLRFRYTSSASAYASGAPLPTGNATDGEVEDYTVNVEELDWGDAPDSPYPTLAASSGANHQIGSSLYLGSAIDGEPNGQPSATANGDDSDAGGDDEDGITFKTPFFPGTVAQIGVTAVGSGLLNIWIDFNVNGSWMDAGEQVYTDYSLSSGTTTLTIPVPTNAVPATNTFMRVRYSTIQSLQPTGYASDGEVEDYQIAIEDEVDVDWGDLPEPGYPVTAANNGAHHIISSGLCLGATVDAEPDGQPTINADGDDINLLYPGIAYPGDEDGVTLTCARLMPGGYASVDVIASQPGILDAWLDFNLDNSWAQPGDQIFNNQPLVAGTNALLFPVPLTASTGIAAHSRFRFTSGAGAYPGGTAVPTGLAYDGEVEDYHWLITAVPSGSDWGDAPDPTYPTLNSGSGAYHTILAGVMLGATIDAETNGQPNVTATGDDAHITYSPTVFDDEDGVTFTSKIVAGTNASVDVVAGVSGGYLDAWIDFNADGDWNDSGEKIFSSAPVVGGLNNMIFPVPQPSALGQTYARFRITSGPGGLPPTGFAPDGEVEDYTVDLYQPQTSTNIVITNITVITSNDLATIEWNAENNIAYQLQSSTNLLTNIWIDTGSLIIGPINWQTNSAAPTSQFYRITAPWTP